MGYSVGMRPKTKALKDKMLAFMEKNYRLPHDVFHELFPSFTDDYSRFTDDMSYDHGRWALGFDYNASEPERDYIFAVTRWMALKIGRNKTFKLEKIGKITVPFYVYDGHESCPLLIDQVWKDKIPKTQGWRLVDDVGFKRWETQWIGVPRLTNPDGSLNPKELAKNVKNARALLDGVCPYKCYEVIHEELKRLNKLWRGCTPLLEEQIADTGIN